MLNNIMSESMKSIANRTLKTYSRYPPNQTALILVDVQKEFLLPDSIGWKSIKKVSESHDFKENIRSLITLALEQGLSIIYVPYTDKIAPIHETPAHKILSGFHRDHKENKASEKDIETSILPRNSDLLFENRTGLSAFTDSDLDKKLREQGIEHLVFAGPFLNIGLDSSVRDAVEYGYHATLIRDCTSALTSTEHTMAVDVTFPRFCQTILTIKQFQEKLLRQTQA